MESTTNMITQEGLKKYFDDIITNSNNQNIDLPRREETYGSVEENITKFIDLPRSFHPTDVAYHKIGDFYLIGICSENMVAFVYFEPATEKTSLIPQKFIITFGEQKNLNEELTVIKSGYIFKNEDGTKREEVFISAGKYGLLYIFKYIKAENSFKLHKWESHFNKINDLCFAPADLNPKLRNLVVCCSNDASMMIWNIYIGCPIICIKPNKLPLDDILAVDWEYPGDKIVSAHLDAIRVWTITEEMSDAIEVSHSLSKKVKTFDRIDSHQIEAKIKNFHDFFIDSIKMFPNNCIATKSVDGTIMVWAYQQFSAKEWHVIPFNKYISQSSVLQKNSQNKQSYFKISYNPYDSLIVAGAGKNKIRVFNPHFSGSLAFKIFKLCPEADSNMQTPELEVIKSFILEPNLDFVFVITQDGKLWYHKIQEFEMIDEDIEI